MKAAIKSVVLQIFLDRTLATFSDTVFVNKNVTDRNYISCAVGEHKAMSLSFLNILFHVVWKLVKQ